MTEQLSPQFVPPPPAPDSASDLMIRTLIEWPGETISIEQISGVLGERAFGILLFLFAVINCLPAPAGVTTILGLPLFLCAIQLVKGRGLPWMPTFINRRSIGREKLLRALLKIKPKLVRLEKLCRPRLQALTTDLAKRIFGVLITIYASCVLIPIPFTHLMPAGGSALMALGFIEKDGLLILMGAVLGVIGSIISLTVLYGVIESLYVAL